MAWIECLQIFDANDSVECSTEIVAGTNLCVYCDNIENHPTKETP